MIPWNETRMARERQASWLAEAERDRLLRQSGVADGRDVRHEVGDRLLLWAVSLHRRLHEIDAAQVRGRQRGSIS